MARDLDAELLASLQGNPARPFMAVHIALPDPVYVWTGKGNIGFEGQTWTGAGGLGGIDGISEGSEGSSSGLRLTLYDVPGNFRDDIEDQATKGALVELYVGALDEGMQSVVGSKLLWKGRLDTYKISDGGDSLSIEINAESRMRDQRRPAVKRFTNEYQQRRHASDLFFEYVSQMAEVPILWAQGSQDSTGGSGGGSNGSGGGAGRVGGGVNLN